MNKVVRQAKAWKLRRLRRREEGLDFYLRAYSLTPAQQYPEDLVSYADDVIEATEEMARVQADIQRIEAELAHD